MAGKVKGRLLIVDDEEGIILVLRRYFEAHGYEVSGAGSAEDAIALVKAQAFDLIFMDSVLPGISGLQAIAKIAPHCKAAIVVMTGHYDEQFKSDAVLLGAADCISKPFDMEEMRKMAVKLLQRS